MSNRYNRYCQQLSTNDLWSLQQIPPVTLQQTMSASNANLTISPYLSHLPGDLRGSSVKISLSTFWLGEPKRNETDLKKPQICQIWGQSDPIGFKICQPWPECTEMSNQCSLVTNDDMLDNTRRDLVTYLQMLQPIPASFV